VTEEEQNVSLSTQICSELILHTILVSFDVNGKKQAMIAIIDTGSQLSYILMMMTL
jgi:hypothetical protein